MKKADLGKGRDGRRRIQEDGKRLRSVALTSPFRELGSESGRQGVSET